MPRSVRLVRPLLPVYSCDFFFSAVLTLSSHLAASLCDLIIPHFFACPLFRGRTTSNAGSPPPMRGKRSHFSTSFASNAGSPPHAGKSASCAAGTTKRRDHPPPMRGKKGHFPLALPRTRITPRPCGEKCKLRGRYNETAGSPRPCGESRTRRWRILEGGITPPMRGKSPGDTVLDFCMGSPRPCGKREYFGVPRMRD